LCGRIYSAAAGGGILEALRSVGYKLCERVYSAAAGGGIGNFEKCAQVYSAAAGCRIFCGRVYSAAAGGGIGNFTPDYRWIGSGWFISAHYYYPLYAVGGKPRGETILYIANFKSLSFHHRNITQYLELLYKLFPYSAARRIFGAAIVLLSSA
jgi:hypothetical protein